MCENIKMSYAQLNIQYKQGGLQPTTRFIAAQFISHSTMLALGSCENFPNSIIQFYEWQKNDYKMPFF